jgi:hypothetical protein
MASVIFNSFKKEVQDGTIDMDANTFYVMLVTSSYTADIDAHTRRNNVTTNEVTGTGYTLGGASITTLSVTTDTTNDRGVWDGADVTWASSTITARGGIIYKSTGVTANDNLVCYIDFGADKSSSNGSFTIQWSTAGIIYLS